MDESKSFFNLLRTNIVNCSFHPLMRDGSDMDISFELSLFIYERLA